MQKPSVASLRSDRHQPGISDRHDVGILIAMTSEYLIDIVGIAKGSIIVSCDSVRRFLWPLVPGVSISYLSWEH